MLCNPSAFWPPRPHKESHVIFVRSQQRNRPHGQTWCEKRVPIASKGSESCSGGQPNLNIPPMAVSRPEIRFSRLPRSSTIPSPTVPPIATSKSYELHNTTHYINTSLNPTHRTSKLPTCSRSIPRFGRKFFDHCWPWP